VNYCSACGNKLSSVAGQVRHRTCDGCGVTHFDKPTIQTSCIATHGSKVLWIKRATEPRKGCWALPSGFLEPGETPTAASARELHEETGASVDPNSLQLFLIGALPAMNQIYLVYRAPLKNPVFGATAEATDVRLLDYHEVDFEQYAYPDVVEGIHLFYRDHARGDYGVYMGDYDQGAHTLRRINLTNES